MKYIGDFIGDYTYWALGTADPDTSVTKDQAIVRTGVHDLEYNVMSVPGIPRDMISDFLAEQGHAFQFLGTPMEYLKMSRRLAEEHKAYGDSRALTDSLTGEEIGWTRGKY